MHKYPTMRLCQQCQAPFAVRADVLKLGNGKFCSVTCFHASRPQSVTLPCLHCGTLVHRFASQIAKQPHHFCSAACSFAWQKTETAITERFWSHVDRSSADGCWIWTGARLRWGYGQLRVGSRSFVAHRFSFTLAYQCTPLPGFLICHRCDNPPCVRPDHLYIGTHKDNAQDRERRGRSRPGRMPGELDPNHKLTEPEVLEIRALCAARAMTHRAVAARYNVHLATVKAIYHRKTWRHI